FHHPPPPHISTLSLHDALPISITEFALPLGNSQGSMGLPVGIASGTDGYLWFTDATGNAIGRITTTGTISEFALPTPQSLPVNIDRKSTRLNSSHVKISYAVFC